MLKEKLTVGEAVEVIENSIQNFQDGLSSEAISKIAYAVNGHIQVRDYLLGLPNFYPIETCADFVSYIALSIDGAERYSFDTVNATYNYEMGNMDIAELLLASALDTKSDYSLAQLVTRVMNAGWPTNSFKEMRDSVHGKVIEQLNEEKDNLI